MQFTGYFINDAVIFRYFKSLSTTCNGCKTCKNACLLLVVWYQQKGAQLCYKIYLSFKKGSSQAFLLHHNFSVLRVTSGYFESVAKRSNQCDQNNSYN